MAVPACFIAIPHAKREDDDSRIQYEDGHGQALHARSSAAISAVNVLELLLPSITSKESIRN